MGVLGSEGIGCSGIGVPGPPSVLSSPSSSPPRVQQSPSSRAAHQPPLLLSVRTNANTTSHQARMRRIRQRTMTASPSMAGTFSHMSPLTSPAFMTRVPVISGMVILEIEITETKERCATTCLRWGKEVEWVWMGVWEWVEF